MTAWHKTRGSRRLTRALLLLVLSAGAVNAQSARTADERAAIAAADSLLAALSRQDRAAMARFATDSANVGSSALRDGSERVSIRSWAADIARIGASKFTERGFAAEVRVHDRVAQVWMPYDLYRNGAWSHCGIDAFTLLKVNGEWKVSSLFYTVEQPPACAKHPAGPPPG